MQHPTATEPKDPRGCPEAIEYAEVRADGVSTRYGVTGKGKAVLVLSAGDDPQLAPLLSRLSPLARVIVPEVRSLPPRPAACLGGFLDGLGLSSIAVVGVGPFAVTALDFTLAARERVTRLVLLPHASPGNPDPDAELMAGLSRLIAVDAPPR